jgi:hypothetical protein
MNLDSDTGTDELTLAFSLSAFEKLDDPKAVFEDAENWSRSIGLVDDDTERIERIVAEYDLRQDFEIQDRDKWFVLEEICETTPTPRHVYVGASDEDMRVSTLFCWEYVRVTEAAKKAGWTISESESRQPIVARLLAPLRDLIE